MVKKCIILLMFLFTALPAMAATGEFTAIVDRNAVSAGESFTLQLTLSNAQAKGAPDTEPLQQAFTIESQGQTSNTTIINGNVTTSTGWELTLIPKTEGKITIPAISIETSDGTLSTKPVTMDVGKASALPSQSGNAETIITAHASTLNPYKGQPLFYTIKIIAHRNVADLSLGDLSVDNAIIQSQGKPKIYNEIKNGTEVNVVEAQYIITPLASGKITIPAVLLQGKVEVAGQNSFNDDFDQAFADPFGMLRHMDRFGGFASYKPFSLASNEVHLEVKPAITDMDPWLPLTSLEIREDWDKTQTARVGEPLTRKITLVADGGIGKLLPSLEAQQNHTDFKVYADKPATEETVKGETIIGTRKESYSLIPLKAGKLVLPEIRVAWWDIKNNHIAYASLPAKTIEVLPALSSAAAPVQTIPAQKAQPAAPAQVQPSDTKQQVSEKIPYSLYALISTLLLALLLAILWGVRMQRKISRLNEPGEDKRTEPVITRLKRQPVAAKGLDAISTTQELHNFIRSYAHEHWGASKNAALEAIFSSMPLRNGLQKETIDGFVRNLTASLYAGKDADVEKLKEQYRIIMNSASHEKNDNIKPSEKLPRLNPF